MGQHEEEKDILKKLNEVKQALDEAETKFRIIVQTSKVAKEAEGEFKKAIDDLVAA